LKHYNLAKRWLLILVPPFFALIFIKLLRHRPLFGDKAADEWVCGLFYMQLSALLFVALLYAIDQYGRAPKTLDDTERYKLMTFVSNQFVKENWKYLLVGGAVGLVLVITDWIS